MRRFRLLPFALGLCLLCAAPANALSYNIDAPEVYQGTGDAYLANSRCLPAVPAKGQPTHPTRENPH